MSSFGDPTFAAWGAFAWGDFLILENQRIFLDSVAKKDDDQQTISVDSVGQKTPTQTIDIDGVAKALDVEARIEIDTFASRLPSELVKQQASSPVCLFEITLPSGILRVASRDLHAAGVGWDARIVSAGQVNRATGDTIDDLELVLDDSAHNGVRISDGFTDANPPEGSLVKAFILDLNDPRESLFEVFRGRIDEVSDRGPVTVTLQVVRADVAEDRVLGRLVDLTDFPNAPDESVGRMVPIVYGDVDPHEGVIVDFNPVSQLSSSIDDSQTTIVLRDASDFPATGEAHVDAERFTWTGKTGNELTGVTRETGGTLRDAHAAGADVAVRGTFEVRVADHPVTDIENVRILDQSENLTQPDQVPTIDALLGKITWPRTPTIQVPSRGTEVVLAGYQTTGAGNSAAGPLNAARESDQFTDLNFARVAAGQSLVLDRTRDLGEPGVLTRAGLIVAFDPTSSTGAQVKIGSAGQLVGVLVQNDSIPDWALARLERQLRATYDLRDPGHLHPATTRTLVIRPRNTLTQNSRTSPVSDWFDPNLGIDNDPNTYAFAGVTNQLILWNGAQVFLEATETISSAFLRVFAGGQTFANVFASFPIRVGLQNTPFFVGHPGGPNRVFVDSPSFSGSFLNPLSALPNRLWFGQPLDPVLGKTYNVAEVELHATIAKQGQAATTGLTQRRAILNFFDLTGLAGGNLDFFTDALAAGRVQITNSPGEVRVSGVYLALEVRPSITVTQETPRVFSRVRGKEPAGRPTEIARDIIKSTVPLGLGLTETEISTGAYARAREALSTEGITLDFAIKSQVSAVALIAELADQADLRQWWFQGQSFLALKPDPDALGPVFKTLDDNEVLALSLRFRRTRHDQIANRIEASYRPSDKTGDFTRVESQEDAASQTQFGRLLETRALSMVRKDAVAVVLVGRRLSRLKLPRGIAEFRLPTLGLELRRADLLKLSHIQGSFSVAEVLGLPVDLDDFKEVTVEAVIWKE